MKLIAWTDDKTLSRMLRAVLRSITVERKSDYRWEGLALLVSFLIASHTLIGAIYHSLAQKQNSHTTEEETI